MYCLHNSYLDLLAFRNKTMCELQNTYLDLLAFRNIAMCLLPDSYLDVVASAVETRGQYVC
jgi:hypothetical protein